MREETFFQSRSWILTQVTVVKIVTDFTENFSGEIVQRDFPITRESFVRVVTQKLQEVYPDHFIRLKNQLLKLRDEQKIANVMDPEDILTAYIQKEKMVEEEDSQDFFVVIQDPLSKRRLFLTPGDLSKLDLHKLPYSQQIAVCRLVRVGQNRFIELILSGKTKGTSWRERL